MGVQASPKMTTMGMQAIAPMSTMGMQATAPMSTMGIQATAPMSTMGIQATAPLSTTGTDVPDIEDIGHEDDSISDIDDKEATCDFGTQVDGRLFYISNRKVANKPSNRYDWVATYN